MRLIAVRSVKQIVRLGRGYDVGIFIWGLPAISTTGWLRKYDRRKHLYIPRKEATYVTLDGGDLAPPHRTGDAVASATGQDRAS